MIGGIDVTKLTEDIYKEALVWHRNNCIALLRGQLAGFGTWNMPV